MEHHAPHLSAAFEGYYSKFDLPSGARIALILCSVRQAKQRPHLVSFTYVPQNDGRKRYPFQHDAFPDDQRMKTVSSKDHSFRVDAPGHGSVRFGADDTTTYDFVCDDFEFHAKSSERIPWSKFTSTPESWLVHLPLPLHWHVQSLGSECNFTLKIPGYDVPDMDTQGQAVVHQEKNWANSFPSAHMWLQTRSSDRERSFCAAGGQTLGMEAFLLGYRSKDLNIDFRPPFAVRIAGWSPFMSYRSDWENRSFEMSLQNFRQKIVVKASAPKGTFFSLSAPFPDGHMKNMLAESFDATIHIDVYESGWFSPWKLVRKDVFDKASLEFGSGYYPPAGSNSASH